jgi:hypothetical protein
MPNKKTPCEKFVLHVFARLPRPIIRA